MADCCDHGNEPSDVIKHWGFLESLRNCQLLKKDCSVQLVLNTVSEHANAFTLLATSFKFRLW